jgi:hypothetical protein
VRGTRVANTGQIGSILLKVEKVGGSRVEFVQANALPTPMRRDYLT